MNFDDFADNYSDILNQGIRFSGESDEYFDLFKINCIKHWILKEEDQLEILDFGCGIGKLSTRIAEAFPNSTVYGYDVSTASVDRASKKAPHLENLHYLNQSFTGKKYDLVLAANVFHHIVPSERNETLLKLRQVLKSNGKLIVFEHNPLNPITRYVVQTCPLDSTAQLIRSSAFAKLAEKNGLFLLMKRYIVFFPKFLSWFRRFEFNLGLCPLGAQYFLLFSTDLRITSAREDIA